jgi:colanic acid biosynthesis glycosyl transferase WcaI
MKILVSSMAFYPDHSGIPLYSSDFAFYAAENGHQVSVVTGFPFYPSWKKRKEDKGVLFRTDHHRNVKIYRGYIYVPGKPTGFKRILQEISFLFFSFINFFRAGRHDVVVVFITPVLLGVMGWFFKKVYGSRLIINIQDFQVEAADSLGLLGRLPIVPLMHKLEKASFKGADLVTSISDGMVNILEQKGVDESKIYLWPNWIDVDEASGLGTKGEFRKQFSIPDNKTIVAYAGNVGEKQGLSTLIDLAIHFKERDDLIFLIIGEGGDLVNLKEYHAEKKVDNLRFLPFLDPRGYKNFLADADVIFISQKKIPKDIYFPSKLLGLMAGKKLIFLAADQESELYRVLKKNDLALVGQISNLAELKGCMNQILQETSDLNKLKENAWGFVRQFDRRFVLGNVLKKIESLVKL